MSVELVPCAGCNRHIYADEPTCPFCHRAPVRGTAAGKAMVVALSAGLSLVACRATEGPPAVYGGPPPPQELVPQPTSTATSAETSAPTSSATTAPTAPAPTASTAPTTPKTKTTTTPPRREPKPLYGMPPASE